MAIATDRPYIFISYAHADSALVLPIVRAMQEANIDLWYDEGIEAGSEWPEYIAEKVMNCSKFVLFISNAYLASQNCKRELNFAISRKKDILSVHLEAVQLSPGMEMQLGTYQAIFRSRFADDATFHKALAEEHFFDNCIPGGRKNVTPPVTKPQTPYQPQQTQPTYPPRPQQPQQPYQPQGQGYQRPQPNPQYQQPQGNPAYRPQQVQPRPQQPQQPYQPQPAYRPYAAALPLKNRILAACLALFLGHLGIHKFYLGRTSAGVWRIILTIVCVATAIGAIVPAILCIVDAVNLFRISDEQFAIKYNCRTK